MFKFYRLLIFTFVSLFQLQLNAQAYWESLNGPMGGSILALASQYDGSLFAGTRELGLLRSMDNCNTWVELESGLPDWNFNSYFAIGINNKGNIFAAGWGSFFKSEDNGETWADTELNEIIYSIAFNIEGDIFAGSNNRIFRSTDNGINWDLLSVYPETYIYLICKLQRQNIRRC